MSETQLISNTLDNLIGDMPISEQLSTALERMAQKDHTHDNYATRNEIEELKRKIELLMDMVGDTPIAEQIYTAIKNNK